MPVRNSFFGSSVVPFRLVFFMWLMFSIEFYFRLDLAWLGIWPRTLQGLIGVFTAPLIHGSLSHLISNSVPLLFLGSVLFFFYPGIGGFVFARCYLITNLLVWTFGPAASIHIGASGLIYGLAAFLIIFGLLRNDLMSLLISIGIILVYGGIFYGVLPTDPRISWQSHLSGAIVGVSCAYYLRNIKSVN